MYYSYYTILISGTSLIARHPVSLPWAVTRWLLALSCALSRWLLSAHSPNSLNNREGAKGQGASRDRSYHMLVRLRLDTTRGISQKC